MSEAANRTPIRQAAEGMSVDPFHLDRFVQAQEAMHACALSELQRGSKTSHWMWFIFPQMRGLGFSQMSQTYGLSGMAEAVAYLGHPVLGPRLAACTQAMLSHAATSAATILGPVDARKFQSCMTVFSLAAPDESLFQQALARFFAGERDAGTLRLLREPGEPAP
jgi:uncharacterized protein (DUF1810 family)